MRAAPFAAALLATSTGAAVAKQHGDGAFVTGPATTQDVLSIQPPDFLPSGFAAHRDAHGRSG